MAFDRGQKVVTVNGVKIKSVKTWQDEDEKDRVSAVGNEVYNVTEPGDMGVCGPTIGLMQFPGKFFPQDQFRSV